MNINYEFVKRAIAGENFLVPIGEAAKQYSGLFALNELGAFLWDKIPAAKDEEDLLRCVLEEYEVSPDEARADIAEFLAKLRQWQIIE